MKTVLRAGAVPAVLLAWAGAARAGGKDLGPDPKEVQALLDKAVAYLKANQQADGSFSPKRAGPGVTALVIAALVRNGVSPKEPVVAKALDYLTKQRKQDGGIYDK